MADHAAPRHMTPDEFRTYGRQVVDWVADYWEQVATFPVLSTATPGSVRAALPAHPPATGEPFGNVLDDVTRVVLPGLSHWQHPSFFGYFPANASGPAVLGELLSAGLGVQGMLWATSPACTELEQHVLDWLAELLDLPPDFRSDGTGGGVIQDTASSATLVALLAALHRATDGESGRTGVPAGATVYASPDAHSSVEKAVRIAGLGASALRTVDTDAAGAMRPEALQAMLSADVAVGRTPVLVVATVGTTSTTAVDPVRALGEVCRSAGAWLHVDAAYAGVAAVCPELRWLHDGVAEYADSYCTNPHKWLLTNFDCDAFYVRDRAPLLGALSVLPEYLRNAASDSGAVVDLRDWQIPLGRRFRALKLWLVLRWYGAEGLQAHVRAHVAAAQAFASWVAADPRFEVVAPHPLSLVCFRLRGDDAATDAANEALLSRLNAGGSMFLTHTRVGGLYTLRLAIGGTWTTAAHVEAAWRVIREAAS